MHGRAQFYCGLGGHARAPHGHIVGRAQVERRRCRHPAQPCFCQTLVAKTARVRLPTTLLRNSAGVATSCTDSRSFFVCFDPDCSLSPTSSGRCGRTRRAGGGQGRCLGPSADAQRSVRVCMPFCGLGSVSHTQDVIRAFPAHMPDPLPCGEQMGDGLNNG